MGREQIENAGASWNLFVEKELEDPDVREAFERGQAKVEAASQLAGTLERASSRQSRRPK